MILGLGLALACAQSIAVVHDFDLETHTPDHTCEICITAAQLSGADAGASVIFVPQAPVCSPVAPMGARAEFTIPYGEPARAPPPAAPSR